MDEVLKIKDPLDPQLLERDMILEIDHSRRVDSNRSASL